MREITLPLTAVSYAGRQQSKIFNRKQMHWAFAASFFAVSGLLCGVIGILLSFLSFFEAAEYEQVNSRIGGWFVLAAFPLMMLAAHGLDRITFYKRAEKIENRRFNPMKSSIFFIFLAAFTSVNAQQTIFNVPTTDVLDKGKIYVELDAAFKTNNHENLRRFSSFTPRFVVGIGGKVEVGVNVIGNIQPGADSTAFVPTVKWKFYDDEKSKTALVAGTNFYVPVRNRAYKFGSYSYVAVSKTINKTRVTAGGYVASKNVFASKAVRGGGQFGIEQTVNSKLSFAADWITGKHASGYFTPGVIYKPHPQVTTYFSYSIGNADAKKGNHFFLFELGYNF